MVRQQTVSQLLSRLPNYKVHGNFILKLYASAFQDFPYEVTGFLAAGSESIVLKLEHGNVLKISKRELTPEMGTRVFDIPILERGTRPGTARDICWYIQPEANVFVSVEDFGRFLSEIRIAGFRFSDPGAQQLGYYLGETKLLDPFAVTRINVAQ